MTIREIFNEQKALMLNFFPINEDAYLIVNTSVFCPVFTQKHKYVLVNSNITDEETLRWLCWKGLMHTIPTYDDIKESKEMVVKPKYKVYTPNGIVYRYCKSKLVNMYSYEVI